MFRSRNPRGAVPIILVVLLLLLIGGVGLGAVLTRILAPEGQKEIQEAKDVYTQKYGENVENAPPIPEAERPLRHGQSIVPLKLDKFDGGGGQLSIDYDQSSAAGTVAISNQGVFADLRVLGRINDVNGQLIQVTLSGSTTSSSGQGTVTADVKGTLEGVIDEKGNATGTISLTQTITNVEGNLPQIKVGQINQFPAINWTGREKRTTSGME